MKEKTYHIYSKNASSLNALSLICLGKKLTKNWLYNSKISHSCQNFASKNIILRTPQSQQPVEMTLEKVSGDDIGES